MNLFFFQINFILCQTHSLATNYRQSIRSRLSHLTIDLMVLLRRTSRKSLQGARLRLWRLHPSFQLTRQRTAAILQTPWPTCQMIKERPSLQPTRRLPAWLVTWSPSTIARALTRSCFHSSRLRCNNRRRPNRPRLSPLPPRNLRLLKRTFMTRRNLRSRSSTRTTSTPTAYPAMFTHILLTLSIT